KSEQILLFSVLPREQMGEVFSCLESNKKDELLAGLTDEETRQLITGLPSDERTQLFVELPGQVTQRLINLLSPENLKEVQLLLGYPEESVGRLMNAEYIAVRPDWYIGEALAHIRKRGKDIKNIGIIYVTDSSWHLFDALELKHFILAEPEDRVEKIMDRTFQSLEANDDRELAVRKMERYDLPALPVLNNEGVLLGIVTVDDVFDIAREEATEDFQKTAAVSPLRISYRNSSIWTLYTKRIGWLFVLILVNLVSSGIIAAYEEVLSNTISLAFFIPLLIGTGGNTGVQSASLMIRSLATEEIKLNQWLKTLLKESGEGLLLCISLGLSTWVLGYYRGGFEVGFVVGLTMIVLVFAANLVGVILPFILTRLRFDPAVASSPLITTLVDALGLLMYFTFASLILSS
ncbi:MAG TPA: magnesium transporter, partial [Anaerovoracaceae bacterium]|nr:magnesium transporter [Anaerovoracaceae bacterium]